MTAPAPLVATKLQAPASVSGYRERPRVSDLLDSTLSDATRLTLISAPPGYGKTVALAGWLGSRGLAHTWLSLDPADNDLARFVRYLVAALWRLVPLTAADRAAYRGLSSAYWLAIISLASACVAAFIGFINLWVRALGPSIFGGFYGLFGLDQQGIQDATLDPHSHMIALAIFGGIVAIAVLRFRALESESRVRRLVAAAGTWIALVGVIGTTLILGAVAFLNFAPPTLFASPDGVNGMAGDDLVMSIVFAGAVVVAAAVLADRRFWRNGLRLTIVGTWLGMVAITVLEGFYIEMNQTQFGGPMAANDAAFSAAHPMTGIFLMIGLSLALLLLDFSGVRGRARQATIAVGAAWLPPSPGRRSGRSSTRRIAAPPTGSTSAGSRSPT